MTDVSPEVEAMVGEARDSIRKASGWTLLLGTLTLLLGLAAVAMPLFTTVAATLVIGWVMVFIGFTDFIRAVTDATGNRRIVEVLLGVAYIVAGMYVLQNPAAGAAAFTLLFAGVIFFHSLVEIFMALALRPLRGWGWAMFAGVAGVVLAALIFSRFPNSVGWVIGLWIGFKLMISGWTMIAMGSAGRALTSD